MLAVEDNTKQLNETFREEILPSEVRNLFWNILLLFSPRTGQSMAIMGSFPSLTGLSCIQGFSSVRDTWQSWDPSHHSLVSPAYRVSVQLGIHGNHGILPLTHWSLLHTGFQFS
jgi:hypothetical protein